VAVPPSGQRVNGAPGVVVQPSPLPFPARAGRTVVTKEVTRTVTGRRAVPAIGPMTQRTIVERAPKIMERHPKVVKKVEVVRTRTINVTRPAPQATVTNHPAPQWKKEKHAGDSSRAARDFLGMNRTHSGGPGRSAEAPGHTGEHDRGLHLGHSGKPGKGEKDHGKGHGHGDD